MRPALLCTWILASLFVLGFVGIPQALPQQNQALSRITSPVDESKLTILKGNVHPLAQAMFDRGRAPASLPMKRMLLVLKRSSQQEQALRTLLDEQQDKSSPNYHKWLTPDQFGQQFGVSGPDIEVILQWLQSRAFQIDTVTRGRTLIEFSGTAAQVEEAFHTEIHKYVVEGKEHWANSEDPQIPAALTSVVAGVATLHNFLKKPQIKIAETRIPAHLQPGASFSCSGLPSMSNCQFSPSSVSGTGMTTLTITTTAPTGTTVLLVPSGNNRDNWSAFDLAMALAVIFLVGSATRRRNKFKLLGFAAFAFVLCAGCGGNSGPPPNPGTPPGTYSVIVTATSGTLNHTVGITLSVE